MIPTDDCDDCRPAYLQRRLDSFPPSAIALSSLPFVFTFLVVATVVLHKLFPQLSAQPAHKSQEHGLPKFNTDAIRPSRGWQALKQASAKHIAAITFSTSIALSTVLVELILCEISNTLNPAARSLALRITLFSLLALIIVITPALELHSWISGYLRSPSESVSTRKPRYRIRYAIEALLLALWLLVFWYLPHTSLLPASLHQQAGTPAGDHGFTEACLERVGIVGISLMASLAGFAAVSSIWQTFGVRHRIVRESDISRKEAGLTATEDMLSTKRSRLRALQRKMSEAPQDRGFVTKVMGSFRSNADVNERKTLEMEISGLETMAMTLSTSVSTLRARLHSQRQAHTAFGRILITFNFVFSLYCLYRIAATSLSSIRRWWQPGTTFATSDPINNVLALLTTHYDPTLDREAWSRQISFALSGVMLLASFNAVLQTFRLFARLSPKLMQHMQTSLPLIISQVAGTYVISSALLLRSNLPDEVSSVITEALGAPLEGRFVEGWFESWFLVAVGMTAVGILISRKVGNGDWDDWDDGGEIEMGKMS
ncbi:hypothetical protein M8818_007872 [Zalaria obscura]|uniref:Uncharacterized protein n=1 Tax=Zalaria obscura TaxID=2024903 RepID=A0ACC3S4D9_9PEZI